LLSRLFFRGVLPYITQSAEMGSAPVLRSATDPAVQSGDWCIPRGFQHARGWPIVLPMPEATEDKAFQLQALSWLKEASGAI